MSAENDHNILCAAKEHKLVETTQVAIGFGTHTWRGGIGGAEYDMRRKGSNSVRL